MGNAQIDLSNGVLPRHDPLARDGATVSWRPAGMSDAGPDMSEEIEDVRQLLLEHATFPGVLSEHLARAVASASMGPNHLWQDLGFTDRGQLNAFMSTYFNALMALNHKNMRWKKFFYRMLCERAEVLICKSPHCEQCEDQPKCFEPD
jgi:nitrogen fixation protein NifQ